jgi:hypothetical protein
VRGPEAGAGIVPHGVGDPHVVTRRHRGQGVGREIPDLEGLVVVDARLARDRPAEEGDAQDRRLVAVRIAHDEIRTAVDPDDPFGDDLERGLLADLPHQRRRGLFPRLHDAAGQPPFPVVAPALQQHLARRVDDHRGDAGLQQHVVADLGAEITHVRGEGHDGSPGRPRRYLRLAA